MPNNPPFPTSPRVVVGLELLHGVEEGIKGRGSICEPGALTKEDKEL